MLAYPVYHINSHIWSLVCKSLLDILQNILDSNAMSKLVKSVKCLLHHLRSFLPEFTNNIEKLCLCCWEEIFPKTLSHDSSYFQSPYNYIKVAIVNKSSNKLSNVSELGIGYFRNWSSLYKLLHYLNLFIPFLCLQYWIHPFLVIFFEYLYSLG